MTLGDKILAILAYKYKRYPHSFMISITLGITAICSYLISTFLLVKSKHHLSKIVAILLAWIGVLLHFSYLFNRFIQPASLNLNLLNAGSIISSLVAFLLLLTALNKPVERLGIVIFPVASISLLLTILLPSETEGFLIQDWSMGVHILSSMIAFSLLNIAAIQAILLAIQEQQLRKHPPKRIIQSLPSLQTMETLLFQMIIVGMIFLTVSLASGFIFLEDLFAQHLAHKTILSLIAWFIFVGLLIGRFIYGWRGQTAVKWTLIGFVLLLLAYFGSKFVLELILKRV